MNIHHLELFYYVARHGGIREAVRNIPYGIQQPAVSGQIAQLEEFLGTTLFHRRPFALTPPGEKLYQFIEPFFSGVDAMASQLQGGATHQIRIGSSDIVLRDHLPELLLAVRKKFPQLKVALREGYQPELETMLEKQEIDVAVTVIEGKPPSGLHSLVLLELPMILMVPKESPLASAEELWKRDKIVEPLISLPANEVMSRNFQQGLNRLGIDWFPSMEINSTDAIETYVANGFGIGLTVSIPKTKMSPKVRALALPGFPPVIVGALWRGKPSPPLRTLLDELQARAVRLKD
ncbi:MAG: Transcriptional regulator, LysR family [Pedosphaera sp.]|nr:Transcriptional regulator, LysR family [Pedosphaera sp.]